MEILEFLVDATILYLIFPAEKLRNIQKLAQHLLHQQTVSVRGLARFVGKTSVLQKAILQAPLHLFVMSTDQSPQDSPEMKFSAIMRLTRELENDLT